MNENNRDVSGHFYQRQPNLDHKNGLIGDLAHLMPTPETERAMMMANVVEGVSPKFFDKTGLVVSRGPKGNGIAYYEPREGNLLKMGEKIVKE